MPAGHGPRAASRARRTVKLVRCLALAATLTVAVCLAPNASAVRAPKLAWKPCADPAQKGFQCATARRIPLDYRHPHGSKIHLALIRHRATDPAASRRSARRRSPPQRPAP